MRLFYLKRAQNISDTFTPTKITGFAMLVRWLSGVFLSLGMIAVTLQPLQARTVRAAAVTAGNSTSVPYGWVDFCGRHAEECNVDQLPAVEISLTPKVNRDFNRINQQVNAYIEPVTNLEHWGTILDHWDYPTDGKGDCKVYALYKRKLLMDMGYPRQALLMTVVRDLQGNGHAILTVRTDKGDLILDNLNENIRLWSETGYTFVKRQSQENPNLWLLLGEANGAQVSVR